ncbi:hypothetical protein CF64_29410 [Bradyrhizobium japonicum]|nr:hypothetical protein CF64_29410 [Bradyrhizobium japonicum]
MLAVPLQKMRMRPIRRPSWLERATGLVDDRSNSFQIVCLARDQDFQIITHADQATVEHPVSGTGQSDPIAHDVRSIRLHRSNVRRRDLCAPHSINELQPGNGTALVVSTQHDPTKNSIAQNSGYRQADAIALLLKYEWSLFFFIELRQPNISINAGQQRCAFRESKLEYSIEIVRRDWPDCRLSTS